MNLMGVYKHNDRNGWYFRTSIDGKQYKRSPFKTRKEALEAEAKFRTNFTTHEAISYGKITVEMVVEQYLIDSKTRLKAITLSNYTLWLNRHIRHFFGDKEINRISRDDINRWRTNLDKCNYTVSYKNKLLRLLRNVFKYSNIRFNTNNRILELESTFRSDEPVKERNDIYTVDEFNRFFSVIDKPMFKAVFTLLFYTGLRIGELRGLSWDDIDFDNGSIHVNKIVTTKVDKQYMTNGFLIQTPKTSSSVRSIDYPLDIVNPVLKDYMDTVINQYGWSSTWFVFGGTKPIAETNLRRMKIKYATMANLHQIRIHDFRHSYISMLYELGVDVTITKEQAGHSSINTTINTYTKISKKTRRDSIDAAFNKLKRI